jgi:hypothetical protein
MRFFIILTILASAAFVASAPVSGHEQVILHLSQKDTGRIEELIVAGDNPDALAEVVGAHRIHVAEIAWHLNEIVRLDRFRTLGYLLPRLEYVDRHSLLTRLLLDGLNGHHPEVCDVLLSQNFQLAPFAYGAFCHTFWISEGPFHWTLDELVHIVTRHPRLIGMIEPESWRHCLTTERCLLMIDFLRHLTTVDEEVANAHRTQPNYLMERIIGNLHIGGEGMVRIMARLVDMGAALNDDFIDLLRWLAPSHFRAIQFLRDVADTAHIKEPNVSFNRLLS